MKGRVYKSTGKQYKVKNEEGNWIECRLRGKFRIKGIKTTNPVAVGDFVDYEIDQDNKSGIITHIHPRKNYLLRRSINLSKQYHILASNIDQVFVVAPVINPETTTTFIDRILVTAEAYDIPAVILINKIDLVNGNPEWERKKDELKNIYIQAGYPVYEISAETGYNVDWLKDLMKDKTSMFTGHSGAGKSSLINAVHPGLNLKTAEISEFHKQGKHTTTFAEMFDLDFGGQIIDTPGIRGFGIIDMEPDEIDSYFPEIFHLKSECKFNNCKHINEPGCAVIPAVEQGSIPLSRYKSYLQILEEAEDNGQNPYRTKKF